MHPRSKQEVLTDIKEKNILDYWSVSEFENAQPGIPIDPSGEWHQIRHDRPHIPDRKGRFVG